MWFAAFGKPNLEVNPGMFFLEIGMEVFFTFSLFFNFIIELKVDGKIQPIRDLEQIAINYLQGSFIFDLIPCLPFQYIDLEGEEKIFYLLKVMRLYIGIQCMDISAIITYIGKYNTKIRLKKMIRDNPVKANDTT